jgi:hypothetical protein
MRWLASRPPWVLAAVFVVLVVAVVFGWVGTVPVVSGAAVVLMFLFFFALLMAVVGRRETPGPHSPH